MLNPSLADDLNNKTDAPTGADDKQVDDQANQLANLI